MYNTVEFRKRMMSEMVYLVGVQSFPRVLLPLSVKSHLLEPQLLSIPERCTQVLDLGPRVAFSTSGCCFFTHEW